MRELIGWLAERKIKPHISKCYTLADTPLALKDMAARKVTGKIVILPQK
jgi:NADPH2:quinone reductase